MFIKSNLIAREKRKPRLQHCCRMTGPFLRHSFSRRHSELLELQGLQPTSSGLRCVAMHDCRNPIRKKHAPHRASRGFSLTELLVALGISTALMGMLFPALGRVKGSFHRVMSMANMRQLGLAFTMYDREYDTLPYSAMLRERNKPQELMIAYAADIEEGTWDGLGRLYSGGYCTAAEVFYSPAHRGEHMYVNYAGMWEHPSEESIYTNYHYAGDVRWDNHTIRRRLDGNSARMILATDGFRTKADLNYANGISILRGDGSVRWVEDNGIFASLVPEAMSNTEWPYMELWNQIENMNN